MKKVSCRFLPAFLFLFILPLSLMLSAVPTMAAPVEKSYAPSSACQKCHDVQYWAWYASMHAGSVDPKNILFTKIYDIALEESKGAMKEKCLSCHAPVAVALGDLNLKKGISREGITCDYCHTLKAEKGEDETVNIISSPGEVKYGPFPDSATEAHKSEFSEIHTKSDICLKCHGAMKSPAGVELCTTEREWAESWYAQKKITCQECHMPPVPGKAGLEGPDREKIRLHNFFGGHDTGILNRAATLDMKVEETDAGKKLVVTVSNAGTGHNFPTASPLRMIILKLCAYDTDGKEIWANWKKDPVEEDRQAVFARLVTDDAGNLTFGWKATKVLFDSRLKPKEQKELTYNLPKDLNIAKLTANLQYKLAPDALLDKLKIDEREIRIPSTIARKELSPGHESAQSQPIAKPLEQPVMKTINVYAEKYKFTPSEIRIRQGERVKLILSTHDDTHGFRVKKLGINVKIFTGQPVEVEIEGKEKGEYPFDCSVPCGDRCFKMKGVIIVE